MSDRRFTLDTNILVYALDRQSGYRHTLSSRIIARALLADCWLTLQSISEFYAATTRKRMASVVRPALRPRIGSICSEPFLLPPAPSGRPWRSPHPAERPIGTHCWWLPRPRLGAAQSSAKTLRTAQRLPDTHHQPIRRRSTFRLGRIAAEPGLMSHSPLAAAYLPSVTCRRRRRRSGPCRERASRRLSWDRAPWLRD